MVDHTEAEAKAKSSIPAGVMVDLTLILGSVKADAFVRIVAKSAAEQGVPVGEAVRIAHSRFILSLAPARRAALRREGRQQVETARKAKLANIYDARVSSIPKGSARYRLPVRYSQPCIVRACLLDVLASLGLKRGQYTLILERHPSNIAPGTYWLAIHDSAHDGAFREAHARTIVGEKAAPAAPGKDAEGPGVRGGE